MATGITDTGVTGASGLIPQAWAQETRDSLLPNLIMPNLMDRSFEAQLKAERADRIYIDGAGSTGDSISGFDVGNQISLSSGGSMTSEVLAFMTQKTLTVNTHAYKFADIDFWFDITTNFPLLQRANERAAYVVRQYIDDAAAGLVDDFSQTVGTLAVGLSDANVLRAVQYLNDADAQENDRFLLCSSAQQVDFLQIDKYVSALYKQPIKSAENGKFKGFFGSLYGLDFYMSTNTEGTNAAGHDNGVWQREAIAIAIIDDQREATDYEITTDSYRLAVHSIFGIIEVRDTSAVWAKGK